MGRINYKKMAKQAKQEKFKHLNNNRDDEWECTGCCDTICNHSRWCVLDYRRVELTNKINICIQDLNAYELMGYDVYAPDTPMDIRLKMLKLVDERRELWKKYFYERDKRMVEM